MLRILHMGLGDIGQSTIDVILAQHRQLRLVGAVDVAPALRG